VVNGAASAGVDDTLFDGLTDVSRVSEIVAARMPVASVLRLLLL